MQIRDDQRRGNPVVSVIVMQLKVGKTAPEAHQRPDRGSRRRRPHIPPAAISQHASGDAGQQHHDIPHRAHVPPRA